jgi:hypothetical protein
MARQSETAAGITYPQLSRDQLDVIIGDLLFAAKSRMPGPDSGTRDATLAYLLSFYTRRWGLPETLHALRSTPAEHVI